MNTKRTRLLNVFMGDKLAGHLHDEAPLAFAYADSWLNASDARSIHANLPLVAGKNSTAAVESFFENLLPEGHQRDLIVRRHQVSGIFGLLAAVGGDTAGAIVLLPPGESPQVAQYEKVSWQTIDGILHKTVGLDDIQPPSIGSAQPRISISGAQQKLLLSLDADGSPLLPISTTPTTHILKPDIARSDLKVFASAANECIVMRTAAHCRLPVAQVKYQPDTKSCLVERYDRIKKPDGSLCRIWQADFCQLSGQLSGRKYEADGGPSFKECFDIIGAKSIQPAVDKRNLLQWLFFNLYTGNNDSHAKNISMLATPNGLRLAPFYDLMCTRVYAGLGQNFSFQIGGESNPGKINSSHLAVLATELGIKPAYLAKIGRDMAAAIQAALPKAVNELTPTMSFNERAIATRLQDKIQSIAKKTHARIFSADGPPEDDPEVRDSEGIRLS